jgi:hypothetical protein
MALDYKIRMASGESTVYSAALDILRKETGSKDNFQFIAWNDHPKRKREDVIKMLNTCIEKLK